MATIVLPGFRNGLTFTWIGNQLLGCCSSLCDWLCNQSRNAYNWICERVCCFCWWICTKIWRCLMRLCRWIFNRLWSGITPCVRWIRRNGLWIFFTRTQVPQSDDIDDKRLKELEDCYLDIFQANDDNNENINELSKIRRDLLRNGVKTDELKTLCDSIIKVMLQEMVSNQLEVLLRVNNEVTIPEQSNYKEKYKMYGLLMSGTMISQFKRKHPFINGEDNNDNGLLMRETMISPHPKDVMEKIQLKRKYPFIEGEDNNDNFNVSVDKALSVTWSMLTLLPPLLVTTDPQYYSEEIHDTNRHTWDEDKREPLYYYRPVLVYGNTLHVAVKGLVGNSEKNLKEE